MSSSTMNQSLPQLRGLPITLPSACWWLDRLPLLVLILSITFLQGYSLVFWGDLLGKSGWGVSLGIEVIHLWAWYRAAVTVRYARAGWMVLAVVATTLLLAGALHEVTRPLFHTAARIEVAAQERETLEAEAGVLRSNLVAYRDMAASQGRRGWQVDIRRDTARLQAITERLRSLTAQSPNTVRRPWLIQVTQGGVVAVAVLFQIAAVLALWSIAGGSRKPGRPFRPEPQPKPEPETISESISTMPETFRPEPTPKRNDETITGNISRNVSTIQVQQKPPETGFYRQLWGQIEAHARSNSGRLARGNGKISQAVLAHDLGIGSPDLSAIKLLGKGQAVPRNPSRQSVEMLSERFGIEMPK